MPSRLFTRLGGEKVEKPATKKETATRAWLLFRFFIKIGFFTFGGGWSILAQMQEEFVERQGWLSQEELLDIVSVGRSLPGIMITNISALFGYHMGGTLSAVAAVAGITLPSLIVLSLVTYFYGFIRGNIYVARALAGIRAAVVPIVFFAAVSLLKTGLKDGFCVLTALTALGLCLAAPVGNVLIVVLGALAGLLVMGRREHGGSR